MILLFFAIFKISENEKRRNTKRVSLKGFQLIHTLTKYKKEIQSLKSLILITLIENVIEKISSQIFRLKKN